MVCGNTLFRPDIREHSALIEKPSAHRKSSRRISGQSESPPLRSGEVFQQTARARVGVGVAAASALAIPSAIRDVFIHIGVLPSVPLGMEHDGADPRSPVLSCSVLTPIDGGSILRLRSPFAERRREDFETAVATNWAVV